MKKRYLFRLLAIAGLSIIGLASCGSTKTATKPSDDIPSSDTPSSDTPSSDTPSSAESKMTREQFLNKIDQLASANAQARSAMTTYKVSMSTTVNGNKLPTSHTGEFTITNGKITVLDKEFTILTTKESFEADYLAGVTSYENEVYGLVESGNYQFNISMTKNDGSQYQFIGALTPQGTFYGGRYYSVGTDGKKTTMWWLAPSAS